MPPPRYTLDLLQETCGKYEATLRETYESCNATTLIRFICPVRLVITYIITIDKNGRR